MDQVVPASAGADVAAGAADLVVGTPDVVDGQQVQLAEQAAQPAEGRPAAVRPGAGHVPGDQDALSLMCEDRLRRRASLGRELLPLEPCEQGRVTLSRGQG